MAVPKRKTSKMKKDSRRAQNMRTSAASKSTCPNCGSIKLPHRVCPTCNYYNGVKVIKEDTK